MSELRGAAVWLLATTMNCAPFLGAQEFWQRGNHRARFGVDWDHPRGSRIKVFIPIYR